MSGVTLVSTLLLNVQERLSPCSTYLCSLQEISARQSVRNPFRGPSSAYIHCTIYWVHMYMRVGRLVSRPINSINLHNCTQACLICIYCVITHINGPQIQRQPPKCIVPTAANAVEECIQMMHPWNDDDNDNADDDGRAQWRSIVPNYAA